MNGDDIKPTPDSGEEMELDDTDLEKVAGGISNPAAKTWGDPHVKNIKSWGDPHVSGLDQAGTLIKGDGSL